MIKNNKLEDDEFDKIRIIFRNGSNKLYSRNQLDIKDNGLDDSVVEKNFRYFTEISKQLDLYNDNYGVSEIFKILT